MSAGGAASASQSPDRPPAPPGLGQQARRLLATLALAGVAGAVAQGLKSPLPWLVGPLLAVSMASMAGLPVQGSLRLRNAGLWILGTALGLYFTPAMVAVLGRLPLALGLGVAWSLALGYGFYRFLAWQARADGVPPSAAFFAAAIGGASEMALLAERHGAPVARVAAAHSLRVVIVVLVIPFGLLASGVHGADPVQAASRAVDAMGLSQLLAATALGCAVLHWLRTPNPWVLGALAASAALTANGVVWSAVPKALSNAGQLAIAVSLGVRFTPAFVRAAPRWLAAVAVGTGGMLVLSAGFGWLLSRAVGLHPATGLLATSPGGIAEMAITASALGLGVPVVTAFHLVRYVAVLVLTEPFWRWEARRLARRGVPGTR